MKTHFKNTVLLFASLFLAVTLQAIPVTFRVDMSEQTVSPNGVHIAGSFQGWNPASSLMTLSGGNIYEITFDLNSGEHHNYKFINGNDWSGVELVPAGCGEPDGYGGYNRFIDVPAQTTILPAVCFSSCVECSTQNVFVTFKVDMTNETVSPNGVHIAGSFQGWDPSATLMNPIGGNVYSVTIMLGAGEYHEYKFINGNAWGFDEVVPPACANGLNRYLTVPASNTTLPVVCFASCDPCTTQTDVDVTFQVDMSQETVAPEGVHIAGSFQGWNPGSTAMTNIGNDIYAVTITLQDGEYHEYKFINGNAWGMDESVPGECAQNSNRYLTVPASNTTLPAVCFASCDPCVPQVPVDVTFQVDMSLETIAPEGVHITGSFQGWDPAATLMTHIGGNVYAVTVSLLSGDYHEYKFINGNAWGMEEIVPDICAQNTNRFLTVPGTNTTLPAVCFASCDPCPTNTVSVTFRVDMSNETVAPEGVHIAGSFQGWTPYTTLMSTLGGNIYTVTLDLEIGSSHEYKFINGDAWGEDESVPGYCAQNGNRYLTVPESNTILPVVCFGSCNICNPDPIEVTFSVDMSTQVVSPNGVHIAGSFQGWDPAATEMTNVGNNIYEYTTMLGENDYHEYKFINGNDWSGGENVPVECSNVYSNRYLVVPESNTVLPVVCFSSCAPCPVPTYSINLKVFLEGPFQGTQMQNAIKTNGFLPAAQPYSGSPWNYSGTETATTWPNPDVVDWVLVELRETTGDVTTATSATIKDRKAGLILKNGDVISVDSTKLTFIGTVTNNLFVVVWHRNHLGVISAQPLSGFNNVYSYNFTDNINKAYGGTVGHKQLATGIFGMFGGDGNADKNVNTQDKINVWKPQVGSSGYYSGDYNMDSQVSSTDKINVWKPNSGKSSQVPF